MNALTFPPDADESNAIAINDLGQVVGSVRIAGRSHAYVWTLEAGMTDIGDLPGGSDYSYATAINNAGQVVGGGTDASGHVQAFRWSPSEGMVALPMPTGTQSSVAYGINARGDVVGVRNGSDGLERPFRWSQETGTVDLTLLESDSFGAARAIADNGDVVGESGVNNWDNDVTRAVLWSADGTKKIIDACTGGYFIWEWTYFCHSSANAINSVGQIAGNSDTRGYLHAQLLIQVNGEWQEIPGVNGLYTSAAAINEAAQVVGTGHFQGLEFGRAFLWSATTGTIDLGALPGRQWSAASGINNRGQVVGTSY